MKHTHLLCLAALWCAATAHPADPPAMGWSSWNSFRVHISDSLICRQADAMKQTGLAAAGYRYINIDDGYFGGRGADGRLLTHPARFPKGLRHVVDHIHALGFKAGIYSDAGRNTCGSYWDSDSLGVGVGLYGHDSQDAAYFFRELGFDFIKVDFCGGDAKQNTEHLQLDERERYTAIRRAIDAAGRPDVRMNVCRWNFPGTWVHGVASSWRISQDINPSWASVRNIIGQNLYLSAYAGPGHYNDMDMLEIGRGLSAAEEETHFGMWCAMSSPLLIGCDLTRIPPASLRLLLNPELIAVNQDPTAMQARPVRREQGALLLMRDVERRDGRRRVAVLYNPGDKPVTWTLRRTDTELDGRIDVRDLISRTPLPPLAKGADTATYRIAPHGIRILKLSGRKRRETQRYEAEWAWLNQYQELWNTGKQIRYEEAAGLSAGAKVSFLGDGPDNWMEWRDVKSRGGRYLLTLHYQADEARRLTLTVNGRETPLGTLPPTGGQTATHRTTVVLNKGLNTIRLGQADGPAPDIDCIDLRRGTE